MIPLKANLGQSTAGTSTQNEGAPTTEAVDRGAWDQVFQAKRTRTTSKSESPRERETKAPEPRPDIDWRERVLPERFSPSRRWLPGEDFLAQVELEAYACQAPETRTAPSPREEGAEMRGRRYADESTPLRTRSESRAAPTSETAEATRSGEGTRGERASEGRKPASSGTGRTPSSSSGGESSESSAETGPSGRKLSSASLRSFDLPVTRGAENPRSSEAPRPPIRGAASRVTLGVTAGSDLKAPDLAPVSAEVDMDASPAPKLGKTGKTALVSEKAGVDLSNLARASESVPKAVTEKPAALAIENKQTPPMLSKVDSAVSAEGTRAGLPTGPSQGSQGEGSSPERILSVPGDLAGAKGDPRGGTSSGQREGGQQPLPQGADTPQPSASGSTVSARELPLTETLQAKVSRPEVLATQGASRRTTHPTAPVALARPGVSGGTSTTQPRVGDTRALGSSILETVERIARLPDRSGSVAVKVAAGHSSEATLHFHRRGEALSVRIVVASEMAAELLNRDLSSLKEHLQGALSSVDVEVANSESQGQRGNAREQAPTSAQSTDGRVQDRRDSINEARSERHGFSTLTQGDRIDIRV